jgi:hypothetical protein
VRHRTKVTKGPGSKAAGLAMAFKLIEAAQARWRAVNAPHLVALVRAGATQQREAPRTTPAARKPRRHGHITHPQVLTFAPVDWRILLTDAHELLGPGHHQRLPENTAEPPAKQPSTPAQIDERQPISSSTD